MFGSKAQLTLQMYKKIWKVMHPTDSFLKITAFRHHRHDEVLPVRNGDYCR